MSWIFFAVLAPLLYSVSNFFDKFLIEKKVRNPMILAVMGGLITCLVGGVVLAFMGWPVFPMKQILILLLAGILFELALVPWYKALSLDDASRVGPLFQSIPVMVLVMSFLFLGERLGGQEFLGFLLVLIGGFLLSVKNFKGGIFSFRKSLGWALLSSFLFAVPLVIFKSVTLEQGFWDSLGYEFLGGGIGAILLYGFIKISKQSEFQEEVKSLKSKTWGILAANEGIYLVSRITNFYAISLVSVTLVTVVGGLQPFFMLIFGLILSVWFPKIVKEDIQKSMIFSKLIAIVLIFIGVWMVS